MITLENHYVSYKVIGECWSSIHHRNYTSNNLSFMQSQEVFLLIVKSSCDTFYLSTLIDMIYELHRLL